MSNSYTHKYEILKTFKKDERQNVLIGSNKEVIGEVVVINILHKDKVSKILFKSQFPKGLHNLVHLEEEDNDLIVITEYKEGTPLDSYLSYFNTTVKHKINLAYEYMTKIVKYDVFTNPIKKILIDESQVNIKNDELYFSELLFLDDKFEEPIDFDIIASKIGDIIKKMVFTNDPTEDKDNDLASKRILEFINKLKNGDHTFNTIESIYDDFRKIYIYDLFMENEYRLDTEDKEISEVERKDNINVVSLPNESLDTAVIGSNETTEIEENNETDNNELQVDESIEDNISSSFDVIESTSKDEDSFVMIPSEILIGNEKTSEEIEDYDDHKKRPRYYIPIAVGAILVAVLLFFALHKPVLNTFKPQQKTPPAKPDAYFEYTEVTPDTYYFEDKSRVFGEDNKVAEISWAIYKGDKLIHETSDTTSLKIRFENEGEYKVVIRIKDSYENTNDYSEIIYNNEIEIDELKNDVGSEEMLDSLSLVYSNKSIVKDYNAFRSGNYSLKLGVEGKTNSEKIIIDDIDTSDKPTVSMWIASSSKENIKISIKGYRNNKLGFQKNISFTPKELNAWEMVEISDTFKNIDKIEITFKDFTSPIWLDDIEISSYK